MLSSWRTFVVLAAAVAATSAAVALVAIRVGNEEGAHAQAEVPVVVSQSSYVSLAYDDRYFVGAADNVFVGRVLRAQDTVETSDTSLVPLPESHFAVEVLQNVKGQLSGTVTVSQDSGYVEYRADRDYPEYGVREGERVRQLTLDECCEDLRPTTP